MSWQQRRVDWIHRAGWKLGRFVLVDAFGCLAGWSLRPVGCFRVFGRRRSPARWMLSGVRQDGVFDPLDAFGYPANRNVCLIGCFRVSGRTDGTSNHVLTDCRLPGQFLSFSFGSRVATAGNQTQLMVFPDRLDFSEPG
jgi:hypothetical protein